MASSIGVFANMCQALALAELSPQDAVLKLSHTQLGQQFPDTVEEIEANAFYYKQKLQQ